jgi:hypothetical protein
MRKQPTRSRFRQKIFFFQIAKLGSQIVRDMLIKLGYASPQASVAEVIENKNIFFYRFLQQVREGVRMG